MARFVQEVPDFEHVPKDITSIDNFFQFGGGPGAHETVLGLGVDTMTTAFGQRFGLAIFNAGSTEGKREFSTVLIG